MKDFFKYAVAVECMTYNHVSFIENTLCGFAMQDVEFPVAYVVIDDASTDGEQDLIRRWVADNLTGGDQHKIWQDLPFGRLAVAPLKGKQQATFVVLLLSENHYQSGKNQRKLEYVSEWVGDAKYIAYCEGDDYWIDNYKLQKQYLLLERNPQAVMVYTGFDTVDETGRKINRSFFDKCIRRSHSGDCLSSLFKGPFILTLTKFLRREVLDSKAFVESPAKYDYSLDMAAACIGDFIFLPDITGCYRKTSFGAIATQSSYYKHLSDECFKYYSRVVLAGDARHISFWSSFLIRWTMAVKAVRIGDTDFLREISKSDKVIWVICPMLRTCKSFLNYLRHF